MTAEAEHIARLIAFWHGAKITLVLPRDRGGSMTVAAQRGYGKFGDAPEQYARHHWEEYASAAEQVIRLMRPDYEG